MVIELLKPLCGLVLISPLLGAILAGVFADRVGHSGVHTLTISGVSMSFICTLIILNHFVMKGGSAEDIVMYNWIHTDLFKYSIGVWIDKLTVIMMFIINSVSLLVHIYSIGYMKGEKDYPKFFVYVSFFTFAMLSLVMANNFVQVFFGWEGVGLASYLLIGFYHHKDSAALGCFKAFLVNRVGDFALLLGIAMILKITGGLSFSSLMDQLPSFSYETINVPFLGTIPYVELTALLLFIGAMGKSAQMPLHVWLPESMEGPTPISALIHAATMVTAGVYLLARLSPLFEMAPGVLSFVLIIGSSGALLLGLVGLVQNDIKRIVAYSTLSQLGYMMAACGVSAYHIAIFHLFTHAYFKALLFLGAGSVIIACHHEQDIRKMGGLFYKMPITAMTFLLGSLSLSAAPFFAGFYSKDAIIEAVSMSSIYGSTYATGCLILGALITAAYSFRAFFLVFIAPSSGHHDKATETDRTMTGPLIVLAIPSVILSWIAGSSLMNVDWFEGAIYLDPTHKSLFIPLTEHATHTISMALNSIWHLPLWFAVTGVVLAYVLTIAKPVLAENSRQILDLLCGL